MSEHLGRSPGRIPSPNAQPATLAALVAWLELAPASTTIAASDLLVLLAPFASAPVTGPDTDPHLMTWRERLWVVPPETRLGVREVAEALGRPVSWCYRHTAKSAGASRLPHRRLDGELVFQASELRTWVREHEEKIEHGRSDASLVLMRRAGGGQ